MTDLLLQIGISNLCISLAICIIAWAVQRTGKFPLIAHLLYVLVLVKLITPPIFTAPVVPIPVFTDNALEVLTDLSLLETSPATQLDASIASARPSPSVVNSKVSNSVAIIQSAKIGLILLWVFGSVCVFAWSLQRIFRFNKLLNTASKVAAQDIQYNASKLAKQLGLKKAPTIYTTSAQLSPMVWWVGRHIRIIIPEALPLEMTADQLHWILAHELAHVRRRDYLVRWLEWLACVCFWWNPVAWWARRNLRMNEEICCDALVLSSLNPKPNTYANALMTVIEFLASPAIRPPAVASEINSGGFLERRFKMIISTKRLSKTPRWLIAGILVTAVGLMPLGVAYAQDHDAVGRRLRHAVEAGELTGDQARAMMGTLKKSTAKSDKAKNDTKSITRKELEAAGIKIKKAIEAGKLSKKEGREKMQLLRKRLDRQARRGENVNRDARIRRRLEGATDRLKQAVEEGKISGKDARARLGELRKEMAELREHHERGEHTERGELRERSERAARGEWRERAERGELRERSERAARGEWRERTERGERRERGERDRRRMTREDFEKAADRLKQAVEAGKISGVDARKRLGEMRKSMGNQGDRAVRLKRIAAALSESGIKRDKIREVMGAMRRITGKIRSEGKDFKLHPRMLAHLKELGLTGNQIELTIGLSKRLAAAGEGVNRNRGDSKRSQRDSKPRGKRKPRE